MVAAAVPVAASPANETPPPAAGRPLGYLQLARLLTSRALGLGPEATPEEGAGPVSVADGGLGSIANARGARLQTRVWPAAPSATRRGLVVFCHGYGTSTTDNAAWGRVAELLTSCGFVCAGLDYMGHGRSQGQRNRVESVESLVDDLLQFVDEVLLPACAPLPVFLRGQSLGGVVALAAALRRPSLFSGLALGAPAFELRWFVWPFAPAAITRGAADVGARLGSLAPPVACFQGIGDTTVHAAGARHLLERCGSADRALYLYVGMGHNMSIEPDVRDWLLARAGGARERQQPQELPLRPKGGALLHVRRPLPEVAWQPPPPGSKDANANTALETVAEPERQGKSLDELLGESSGNPL